MKGIFTKNVCFALISSLIYIVFRVIFHQMIKNAGFVDGGLLSYDSYYQYAFAEELHRNSSLFLFQNPFGSLDSTPHLFSLYASFLEFLRPLYVDNLFVFDVIMSAIALFTGAFFLLRVMKNISTLGALMLFFGGGVNFIIAVLRHTPGYGALWTFFWGLNFFSNQLATPEIIYHALFFWGLCALLQKHHHQVIVVSIILALLHPFTSITFGIAVLAWCIVEYKNERTLPIKQLISGITSIGLPIYLFDVLLPSISKDALFYRSVYSKIVFEINPIFFILSISLPILLCFFAFIWSKKTKNLYHRHDFFVFSALSVFCITLTLNIFPYTIPQPAHWSRVYPFVFLCGIFFIIQTKLSQKKKMIMRTMLIIFIIIGILDNTVGLYRMQDFLLANQSAPMIFTHDQSQILKKLSNQKAGNVIYFRDCLRTGDFGAMEYSILSLTPQKAIFGHVYFSPEYNEWKKILFPCKTNYKLPAKLFTKFKYVIFDKSLQTRMKIPDGRILFSGNEQYLIRLN